MAIMYDDVKNGDIVVMGDINVLGLHKLSQAIPVGTHGKVWSKYIGIGSVHSNKKVGFLQVNFGKEYSLKLQNGWRIERFAYALRHRLAEFEAIWE